MSSVMSQSSELFGPGATVIGHALYHDRVTGRQQAVQLARDDYTLLIAMAPTGEPLDRWWLSQLARMPDLAEGDVRVSVHADALAELIVDDPVVWIALYEAVPALRGPAHRRSRPSRPWFWGLSGLVALAVFLCVLTPPLAHSLAALVPQPLEKAIGTTALNYVRELIRVPYQKVECTDSAGLAALRRLVAQLNLDDAPPFSIVVMETDTPFAAAVPGGIVLISNGIFGFGRNSAAVQGVVAHEVGHLVLNHGLPSMFRAILVTTAFDLATGGFGFGFVGLGASEIWLAEDQRRQEREADLYARQVLKSSNISAVPLAVFLEWVDSVQNEDVYVPDWIRSHPPGFERADLLRDHALLTSNPLPPAGPADWEFLLRICGNYPRPDKYMHRLSVSRAR
jgi:beta-barrel assembly-enhancing protease